ncbi:MAG: C4-type zinc ribbon domain-containing protein [Coriobacteriia bacterium]|nr:C4-type zinc ribbon domain-containing protein [Coriobacteriia bacterium]
MALTKEEQSLLEVQEIDIKLGQVSDGLEKAPHKQRIAAARAKIAEGEKRLALIEAARADLEQKTSELQVEVDEFNGRMKTHQETMQQSSDHRAVENLSKELETLLKQKEKRENEGMNLMEKRAEFGSALTDTAEKVEQLKKIEADEMSAYKAYFTKLKAVHDALMVKRKELLSNVNEETVDSYEKVRKSKNGIGVALYENGKCGGCQVMIPMAQRSAIEAAEGIVTCPSCKRLLIVER